MLTDIINGYIFGRWCRAGSIGPCRRRRDHGERNKLPNISDASPTILCVNPHPATTIGGHSVPEGDIGSCTTDRAATAARRWVFQETRVIRDRACFLRRMFFVPMTHHFETNGNTAS